MTREVSRTTFRERYNHLVRHLREKIGSGEWAPGTYIPAENELAQTFQLSRPSVRKALGELADAHLIRTLHGIGSIVNDPEPACTTLQLFWGMPSFEYEAMNRLVRQFNRSQKQIQVEMIEVPKNALTPSHPDGFRFGRIRPDLVGMSNTVFYQIAGDESDRYLLPLELPEPQSLYETYCRSFAYNGKQLAAPVSFAPIVLAYNKSLFDQAGLAYPEPSWTWEQLLKASLALTRYEGGQAEQYGFSFSSASNRWPAFVMQNGGSFQQDGELLPHDPATKEALQFAVDLMYKHKVSPIFSTENFRLGEMLFLREKVGMILTSYVFLEEFRDIAFDWDLVAFPGRVTGAGLALATGVGISSHSGKTEEARRFIRYLLSEEAQSELKYNACSIPARISVAEDRNYPHHPAAGRSYYAFEQMKQNAYSIADFGLSAQQFNALNEELRLVWANVASVDEVWDTLRAKWSVSLSE